jgi:AcrR family transcriptional regulator
MVRLADPSAAPRAYSSRLRDEQVDATRIRILDATLRVMARGVAALSIPAVAREAGVSIPTVYRHFGSKPGLLAAVYPHVARRSGLPHVEQLEPPRSLEGLRSGLRDVYARMASIGADELVAAAFSGPAAEELRHVDVPRRLAAFKRLSDAAMPELSETERERVARLLVVLTTSSAARTWLRHLGSSPDGAADDVAWVIRSAVAGAAATRRDGVAGR